MDISISQLKAGNPLFSLRKDVELTPPYVLNKLMRFGLNALFFGITSGIQTAFKRFVSF